MSTTLIFMVGGGLMAGLVLFGLVVTARQQNALVDKRVNAYWEAEKGRKGEKGERANPLGDWLNRRAERSKWGAGAARELARADLKLKVGEYLAMRVIAGAVVATGLYLAGESNFFIALGGGVVGYMLPKMYVGMQKKKRYHKFNDQLADMLNLMVNGLRAGYSTMQSMEAVSKEMPAPISVEMRRVVQEMQLGVPMESALDNLFRRVPSGDLDLVITAINVQREVGGNLAEILSTISHTIRERVRIKGEVRVLSSQAVYSGRFLSLLPVLLSIALYFINRDYFLTFFDEPKIIGIIAFSAVVLLIVSGSVVMNKIGDIEV
jgi:tight adherence protein B